MEYSLEKSEEQAEVIKMIKCENTTLYAVFISTVQTMMSIDLLPKKTYNCEPFGLMFMIDGSLEYWTCQYYSHYSKKTDDRFPQIRGATIEMAANNMLDFISQKYPDMLLK